jgi:hypothetical protein
MSARFASRAPAVAAALLCAAGAAAQEALQVQRERVLQMDMLIDSTGPIEVAPTTGGPGVAWRRRVQSRFPQSGPSGGIRVHVRFDAAPTGAWSLRILDGAGVRMDGVGSAASNALDFWSDEVPEGTAEVELRREAAGTTPRTTIEYAYHVTSTQPQAITWPNQLMSIADAPRRIRLLGRPIARLRFMIPGEGEATCTAFLVGRRLLLTNQHCIANEEEMQSAIADFNYDSVGGRPNGIRAKAIVATSAGLDYTLLDLTADPPAGSGRLYFAPAQPAALQGQPLFIIQHPSGRPKEVSIADCRVEGIERVGVTRGDRSDFGHLCDTLGGSSGSPVLDWQTGLVIGLHHFGFVAGSPDPVNQAVHRARILADIAAQNQSAHAEVTRRP